jgi:hypothetical protein
MKTTVPIVVTVALQLLVAAPIPGQTSGQTSSTAGWRVLQTRSEMTDKRGITLTLRASSAIEGILGPATPSMIIRCTEEKLDVYVNSTRVLDSDADDDTDVRLRYDNTPPVSEEWTTSTDHTSAFAKDPGGFVLGRILDTRVFKIELSPFDAAPVVATFQPFGLRSLLPRLRSVCPVALAPREAEGASSGSGGDSSASRTEDTRQTYYEFQVEKPAAQIPGTGKPLYPDALRSSGVEGEVQAQFVVTADGKADVSTFKILKATNDLFAASVRVALPAMRFYPAETGGKKVDQLLQLAFTFSRDK